MAKKSVLILISQSQSELGLIFTYNITPAMISITDTGLGKCSVIEDIEAVLRKIEHWHQASIAKFKIMCRDGKGFWHGVRRDGKTAAYFALQETDERNAGKKLLTDLQ